MMKFFMRKFSTSNTIYGEYMANIDLNENIVTQKFQTNIWRTKLMQITVFLRESMNVSTDIS